MNQSVNIVIPVIVLALACAAASPPDNRLEDAIVQVESGGRADAVGDNGQAVGLLQIHPIMVREVNRITGAEYTLEDRLDPIKSREMFRAYSSHWCRQAKDWSDEGIARRWNGGPRGHTKPATVPYWNKVKREMKP